MNLEWRDLWALYCPELNRDELDRCVWLQQTRVNWLGDDSAPVEVCDWLAQLYVDVADEQRRKQLGQYFTPPQIARFMASLVDLPSTDVWAIEPAAGLGILIAALAERIVRQPKPGKWHVTAYEIDEILRPALNLALGYARHWLNRWGIQLEFEVRSRDFILDNAATLRPAPLLDSISNHVGPDLVIANPPYFKIAKSDPRTAVMSEVVHGQPNIYMLFMAAAAKLLRTNGQMVFITPRSFCSGTYFKQFRKWFFQNVCIARLHAFTSRTEAFSRDEVLQENVIFKACKAGTQSTTVDISSSYGMSDLENTILRSVPLNEVLDIDSAEAMLSIPVDPADSQTRHIFGQWSKRLRSLGLEISTGPVVPFRTAALVDEGDNIATAPLIWVQHVQRMATTWPLTRFDKPQRICVSPDTFPLLLPNQNYVLIRRFSPKEDNSRIVATPYLKGDVPSDYLGVENHVNYLHRPHGILSETEAIGLAAFLNSRWVDQYFRMSSGNTQVNAAELRALPLPSLEAICRIGQRLRNAGKPSYIALLNQVVGEELELPLTHLNGDHMPKIEEAKNLLNLAGLPPAQRNELAALTLLAVANLTEDDPWRSAQQRSIRIHDMIAFVEKNFHKHYAENTRETFRRQVLHQFEQAGIVDRNPEDPSLPTNSPRTHYALSEAFLSVVQNYGTKTGERLLKKFIGEQGTLVEVYQQRRSGNMIALRDATGHEYRLSPGKHNQLQVAVMEQFAPRFAPGAKLLYLGDTANKSLVMDSEELARLGFPVDKHSKLPDVVLYLPKKRWLYLIEVVTSHGPVSPKRFQELEKIFDQSAIGRVYVSAFPDFKEYIRHARNIAWETEVWLAEAPDHLIHLNGDKFIGPRQPRTKSQ
ncbi:MAG: Eco57I restriction-modification methylase domain-containing protein [Thermoflexales bacterium]|nr:Eco57I restriction-modification methylase domain-containing protein [Thermoflexales bacterium]